MFSNMRYVPPKIQEKSRGMQGGTDAPSKGHQLHLGHVGPSTGANLGGRGYGDLSSGGGDPGSYAPYTPATPKFKRGGRVRAI